MRLKKSDLYQEEQQEIKKKLYNILNLEKKNSFTLYELDNNKILQQEILNLIPEIKKYFKVLNIKGVTNTNTIYRPWLSIIRHLIKEDFDIYSTDYTLKLDNNIKIRTKKYKFLSKNI